MVPWDHEAAMHYCSGTARSLLPTSAPSPAASVTTSASRLFLAGSPSSTIAQVTRAGAAGPAVGHRQWVASKGAARGQELQFGIRLRGIQGILATQTEARKPVRLECRHSAALAQCRGCRTAAQENVPALPQLPAATKMGAPAAKQAMCGRRMCKPGHARQPRQCIQPPCPPRCDPTWPQQGVLTSDGGKVALAAWRAAPVCVLHVARRRQQWNCSVSLAHGPMQTQAGRAPISQNHALHALHCPTPAHLRLVHRRLCILHLRAAAAHGHRILY